MFWSLFRILKVDNSLLLIFSVFSTPIFIVSISLLIRLSLIVDNWIFIAGSPNRWKVYAVNKLPLELYKTKKQLNYNKKYFYIYDYPSKNDIENTYLSLKKSYDLTINKYCKGIITLPLNKINDAIKTNLNFINDFILINNNNQKSLIILSDLDYNKNLSKQLLFDEKILEEVQDIENEFLLQKKIEYNLKIYE